MGDTVRSVVRSSRWQHTQKQTPPVTSAPKTNTYVTLHAVTQTYEQLSMFITRCEIFLRGNYVQHTLYNSQSSRRVVRKFIIMLTALLSSFSSSLASDKSSSSSSASSISSGIEAATDSLRALRGDRCDVPRGVWLPPRLLTCLQRQQRVGVNLAS